LYGRERQLKSSLVCDWNGDCDLECHRCPSQWEAERKKQKVENRTLTDTQKKIGASTSKDYGQIQNLLNKGSMATVSKTTILCPTTCGRAS
jgi:hypothetical protein